MHTHTDNVVRFCDYERRSRNPDAAQPRNPCDADVIVLPVIRIERHGNLGTVACDMTEEAFNTFVAMMLGRPFA